MTFDELVVTLNHLRTYPIIGKGYFLLFFGQHQKRASFSSRLACQAFSASTIFIVDLRRYSAGSRRQIKPPRQQRLHGCGRAQAMPPAESARPHSKPSTAFRFCAWPPRILSGSPAGLDWSKVNSQNWLALQTIKHHSAHCAVVSARCRLCTSMAVPRERVKTSNNGRRGPIEQDRGYVLLGIDGSSPSLIRHGDARRTPGISVHIDFSALMIASTSLLLLPT